MDTPYAKSAHPSTGVDWNPTIMLTEPRDSTGSSMSMPPNRHIPEEDPPVTLGLELRRARLVGVTALTLILIVGSTLWIHHGFSVKHFDSRDKNATEQTKILNDYNSYAGNVAAIFATPLELFVTISVQLIVLRFMADTFTRPELSWRISALTLLLGAAVGYLMSNGLNALNVQLRPQGIHSVISGVDMGRENYVNRSNQSFIASYAQSISELQPKNPVTNTIFHTIVVPPTPVGTPLCKYSELRDGVSTLAGTLDQVDRPFLNLGLPQREWQSRILQEALPSKTLRLVVNPTNKTVNNGVQSASLPMNASRAAMLFNYAMNTGTYFFPWGARRDYVNKSDILARYQFNDTLVHTISDRLPEVNGLLPPDDTQDETAQRAFFLPAVLAAASRQFAKATRTKTSDIVMEFSHTQISSTITFDAITLEVEIDPTLLATTISTDNTTRYTVVNQRFDCPVAQHCFVRKPTYAAVRPLYDSPAQVVAFRMCTNWDNSEVTHANVTIQNNTIIRHIGSCADNDQLTRSIVIMSIGKRVVADALDQNVSIAANGTIRTSDFATITNLRKIYTFTVGRLGWEYIDLDEKFHAKCEAQGIPCRGLELPLANPLGSSTHVNNGVEQRLVVGIDAITHAQNSLLRTASRVNFDKTTLIAVAEPPELANATDFYRAMSGDLLLPHNIRTIKWDLQSVHPQCDLEAENRVIVLRSQHQYMEQSLQSAYTAATYFLFQSAVVRDKISLSSTKSSLAFQRNSQAIDVWVSTPKQNMWLTLCGCFVLISGLIGTMIKSQWFTNKEEDVLAHITEPHAIARVMMDERRYPPLFLRRHVVEKDQIANVDNFAIATLSLQQQQEREARGLKRTPTQPFRH